VTLEDVLFAPEWWMLVAGTLLAVVAFVLGNRRLDNKLMASSGVLLLFVGIWWLIGWSVETSREAALGGTRRFIAAVVARDERLMIELLSPAATLGAFNRDDIASSAKVYAEQFGLKSALITGSELEERGSQVNCTIRVISQHEGGQRNSPDTLPTDWQFTWGKMPESDGGNWKIVQITPIRIGNQEVSGIVGRFFTRRPS